MNNSILFLTDHLDCHWVDQVKNKFPDHNFDILVLGLNTEAYHYENKDKLVKLKSYKIIDVADYSESAQEKVRKFIPEFLYRFPMNKPKNMPSLLELMQFGRINFWWFLKMSEKAGLSIPLVSRLFYLELFRQTLMRAAYRFVYLDLLDNQLAVLLKNNKQFFPKSVLITRPNHRGKGAASLRRCTLFFLSYLLKIFILKFFIREKNKFQNKKTICFFTLFPFFWRQQGLGQGRREVFFQSLPESPKISPVSCYLAWVTMGWRKLWQQRAALAVEIGRQRIFLVERFLTFRLLAVSYFIGLIFVFKTKFYCGFIFPKLSYRFEGVDIANLVKDELRRSLAADDPFQWLLLAQASRQMAAKVKGQINTIIYRLEFQPFERALLYGWQDQTACVAFQHQAIARNHLQYFFAPNEIISNSNLAGQQPLADFFVVSGNYPYNVFIHNGFSASVLGICGPLRYTKLIDCQKNKEPKDSIRKKYQLAEQQKIFLVAVPLAREEVVSLMYSLVQAMQGITADCYFIFKSHPAFKFDGLIEKLIKQLAPQMSYNILKADNLLYDYLCLADGLILTGTTLGLEAIVLGTMPILFETPACFTVNPLLEIKNACLNASNVAELKRALQKIINNDEELSEIRQHWGEAIRITFDELTKNPNERFINLLEKWLFKDETKQ